VTRTDRRGGRLWRSLPPSPPQSPLYVAVEACDVAETTRRRTSAGVDASATRSRGNFGTGLEGRTAEDDLGRVCAALTTAAGEEDSGGFSTTTS
jgi:hypothetical protein